MAPDCQDLAAVVQRTCYLLRLMFYADHVNVAYGHTLKFVS